MAETTFRLTSQFKTIEEGWAHKQGHVHKNWKLRFFSFDMKKKTMNYYSDEKSKAFKGSYRILPTTSTVRISSDNSAILILKAMKGGFEEELLMKFNNESEKLRWMQILMEAINGVQIRQPKLFDQPFHNSFPLSIVFEHDLGKIIADNGMFIDPKFTEFPPIVRYAPLKKTFYTLMMVNAEAPLLDLQSEAKQQQRLSFAMHTEYMHWVVMNIPECDIAAGTTVCHYTPAWPLHNAGKQRYFFLLFQQDRVIFPERFVDVENTFKQRFGQQVSELVKLFNLGLPVGFNGFHSEWSEFSDGYVESQNIVLPDFFHSPLQRLKTGNRNANALTDDVSLDSSEGSNSQTTHHCKICCAAADEPASCILS